MKNKKVKIDIKYKDKRPFLGLIQAVPYVNGQRIFSFLGVVGARNTHKKQLMDLGIKPGMRFFIIKPDAIESLKNCFTYSPRAQYDEILSRGELKQHQIDKERCKECEHSFGHKHYKKWQFTHCRDCGDGLNIVESFVIDESYYAAFGAVPPNHIKTKG